MRSGVFALVAVLLLLLLFSAASPAYADGSDNSPTLTEGRVTPDNGAWGSTFTFEVTYTDNENTLPATPPKLCIDNEAAGRGMMEKDNADNDVTDGKIYEYLWPTTKDDVGDNHTFYFFVENVRDPATGAHDGPTLTKRSTFLDNWKVDNPEPASGEDVTFNCYLRTSDDNRGVAGENLDLYRLDYENNVRVGSATTDNNGHFSLSIEAPSSGIFFYEVRFPGDNFYEGSESSRLYVTTLSKGLVLGISAAVLLALVGILMFLLSRGMERRQYLKPVLWGFVAGFFLYFIGAGFISLLAAGGIAGYLFAKGVRGWTKYLRVGCMVGFLIMPILGILFMYSLVAYPDTLLPYSVTQGDVFMILFYRTLLLLVFFAAFSGLAATIGGMLRGGPKPREAERTEQLPAKS